MGSLRQRRASVGNPPRQHGEREGERARGKMKFLQNLMSYWANMLLVETLANSRTFQRFAISSDKALRELKKKGDLSARDITKQASAFSEEMTKAFRDEMMK